MGLHQIPPLRKYPRSDTNHGSGNRKPFKERCHSRNDHEGVCISNISKTQTVRGLEANLKPEISKPIPCYYTLQDGRAKMFTLYGSTELTTNEIRHQRCVLDRINESSVLPIHSIPMEYKTTSVSCHAIWPEYSALDLYQNNETPHKVVESTRSVHDNILGRYTTCNTRLRYDQATHSVDYITLNSSKVRHKLGKINSETTTQIDFLGIQLNSEHMTMKITEPKLNKILTACRKLLTKESDTARNITHLIGLMTHEKLQCFQLHCSTETCSTI